MTAKLRGIAVQAALTGHRVFSTIHTNDAAGAVTRLLEMGIEPFLVSSVLLVSFAQRLMRTICPSCKEDYMPPERFLRAWKIDHIQNPHFRKVKVARFAWGLDLKAEREFFEVLEISEKSKRL